MKDKKTNNDAGMLEAKIRLRFEALPAGKKDVRVLDCFSGEGVLWKKVKARTNQNIRVLGIDKNRYRKVNLTGDNVKFLLSLPLEEYDIIDLDAWGSPVPQLEILHRRGYKGRVICTFISTFQGALHVAMLQALGYTEAMYRKAPALLNKNGYEKFLRYLNVRLGVTQIRHTSNGARKHYLSFNL